MTVKAENIQTENVTVNIKKKLELCSVCQYCVVIESTRRIQGGGRRLFIMLKAKGPGLFTYRDK